MSLLIFRDAGIIVAVTANMADADTSALARKVADAFAEQAPSTWTMSARTSGVAVAQAARAGAGMPAMSKNSRPSSSPASQRVARELRTLTGHGISDGATYA